MTDTPHPLAALLAGVPRYACTNAGDMEDDPFGKFLFRNDVLAALTLPDMDEAGKVLEGVTDGPWTLCAHLANDNENGCPCGYRGVIYAGDTEYAICQPGHDVVPGQEGLEPPRLPRAQEVANARFIAWCRTGVPAILAQRAADAARIRELEAEIAATDDLMAADEARIAALEATVERMRGAIINRLHSYDEEKGDLCGCAACADLFAAITEEPK